MDDQPIRRAVKVKLRQRLNPDGSLLISKTLSVRTTTQPAFQEGIDAEAPRLRPRDVFTARINGIVLNESLRPRAGPVDELCPALDDENSLQEQLLWAERIKTTTRSKNELLQRSFSCVTAPPKSNNGDVTAVKIPYNHSKSSTLPPGYRLASLEEDKEMDAKLNSEYQLKSIPLNSSRSSGRSSMDSNYDHNNMDLYARARNENPSKSNFSPDYIRSVSMYCTDQARRTENTMPADYNRSISHQQILDPKSIPFYRCYSQEVFNGAPKLNSFGTMMASNTIELTDIERPLYFVNISSKKYALQDLLAHIQVLDLGTGGESRLNGGERLSDQLSSTAASLSDEEISSDNL